MTTSAHEQSIFQIEGVAAAAYQEHASGLEAVSLPLPDAAPLRVGARLFLRAIFTGLATAVLCGVPSYLIWGSAGLNVVVIGAIAVFYIVLLGTGVNQSVVEWQVLLASRAQYADSAYSVIAGELARQRAPVRIRSRRIVNDEATHTVVNCLLVTDAPYTAFVSLFSYGTSLVVRWHMSQRYSLFGLVRTFAEWPHGAFASTPDADRMLRLGRGRAMRDAVHLACQRAVRTVATETEVPIDFGFPGGLPPIEERLKPSAIPAVPMPLLQRIPDDLDRAAGYPKRHVSASPQGEHPPAGLPELDTSVLAAREIAVSIYLADPTGHELIQAAVDALLTSNGYEVISRGEPVVGR